jgi:hypothetical protein
MAYVTVNGVAYLVEEDSGRGRVLQVEQRRRAIDGSLLVDSIATKLEVPLEFTGLVSAGRFFTVLEATVLMGTLLAGNVTIGGDVGNFTARATDVGWRDMQHRPIDHGPPVLYRWVSCTLEEV